LRLDAATAALLSAPPLFWAGNAVAARLLVGEVPPVALSLARWVLAFALLAPFAWRSLLQHRAAFARHWRILLAIGPLGVGAYNTLQYLALQTSTPGGHQPDRLQLAGVHPRPRRAGLRQSHAAGRSGSAQRSRSPAWRWSWRAATPPTWRSSAWCPAI
jgi:Integral membrane protein DUF6.